MVNPLAELLGNIVGSLQAVVAKTGASLAEVSPGIIAALIIVLIGWVVARIVKQVVIKLLQSTKIDQWIDEQNLTAAIGGKEISSIIGSLSKWYILGIFLAQAAGRLELEIFENYLTELFIKGSEGNPPVFFALLGAVVVALIGLLVARYARNIIEATTFKMKRGAGVIAEAIVVIFAGIIVLNLVFGESVAGQVLSLLQTFIEPFIWAFAIVLAIVIGVRILIDWKDDLKKLSGEIKKSLK